MLFRQLGCKCTNEESHQRSLLRETARNHINRRPTVHWHKQPELHEWNDDKMAEMSEMTSREAVWCDNADMDVRFEK